MAEKAESIRLERQQVGVGAGVREVGIGPDGIICVANQTGDLRMIMVNRPGDGILGARSAALMAGETPVAAFIGPTTERDSRLAMVRLAAKKFAFLSPDRSAQLLSILSVRRMATATIKPACAHITQGIDEIRIGGLFDSCKHIPASRNIIAATLKTIGKKMEARSTLEIVSVGTGASSIVDLIGAGSRAYRVARRQNGVDLAAGVSRIVGGHRAGHRAGTEAPGPIRTTGRARESAQEKVVATPTGPGDCLPAHQHIVAARFMNIMTLEAGITGGVVATVRQICARRSGHPREPNCGHEYKPDER